jgi:hypothetical protein
MPELHPMSPPDGTVGTVRGKSRRIVNLPDGSSYSTPLSEAEEQLANERLNAERAAIIQQNLSRMPVAVAQAVAAREAAEERAFNEQWPDPRQSLRDAHAARQAALAHAATCREQASAAAAYIAQCTTAVEHTRNVVGNIRQQQAARLKAQLAGAAGRPARLDRPDDDAAEVAAMREAEKARRSLALGEAAQGDIAAAQRNAEAAVSAAQRKVEEAAKAVCQQAYRELRGEIAAREAATERLRRRSWDLQAAVDYQPQRWRPHLRKLVEDDPEGPLVEAEEGETAGLEAT